MRSGRGRESQVWMGRIKMQITWGTKDMGYRKKDFDQDNQENV